MKQSPIRAVSTCLALSAILFCVSCVYTPTDSFYYDELFNKELVFCKNFLTRFFLIRVSLPPDDSLFTSVDSLFKSVDEPFTEYMNRDTARAFRTALKTQSVSSGHGIIFDSTGNGIVVSRLFQGSPGDQSLLQCGDTIYAVNGVSLAGLSMGLVNYYLGEGSGNTKILEIKRDSSTSDTLNLGAYTIPSVYCDSVDSNIAYIYIAAFFSETGVTGGTAEEMRDAFSRIPRADTVILDLRNNPGGSFDQCLQAASLILATGKSIILTTEWRVDSLKDSTWVDTDPDEYEGKTYFLLINDSTAGAAEVLVSCLKENGLTHTITGSTTCGFGYKQVFGTTPDSGIVKITTGYLTTILGDSFHETGIIPDDSSGATDALERVLMIIKGNIGDYTNVINRLSSIRKQYQLPDRTRPLCYTWEN